MKKTLIAVVLMGSLFSPAYAQEVKIDTPVVQSDLDALRQQLIKLLFELIGQLQEQLEEQSKSNEVRDQRVSRLEKEVVADKSVAVAEETSNGIEEARKVLGTVTAAASLQEDDEDNPVIELSVTNYLDIDNVEISASSSALYSQEVCDGVIANSEYQSCATYQRYAVDGTDLVITISVNGQVKELVFTPNSRTEKTNWPRL